MPPQYYDMSNFPQCEAKRQWEQNISKINSGEEQDKLNQIYSPMAGQRHYAPQNQSTSTTSSVPINMNTSWTGENGM